MNIIMAWALCSLGHRRREEFPAVCHMELRCYSAEDTWEERMRPLLLFLLFSIHPMYLRCHIEHTLWQLDAQAGAFVDELVQELQHEIIRVARL